MARLGAWLGAAACVLLLGVSQASAQFASLLSDTIIIQNDTTIIATGNVEILIDGARLQAGSITYNARAGTLQIEGPIILHQNDGTLFLASSADLDTDLRNGVLRSARMVLNQQLQLAAAQINRVDGRYTQLSNTIASSCKVCASNPVPLWQIRADKIIHDQQERQLYFENAQLLIGRVPVFFIPRLRLPDPTLKRATGFLVPSSNTSTQLGTGFKIPYFIAIGDSADITLTPYISPRTLTLGARYRQAFARGRLQFDAALTRDKIRPGVNRAYLFGNGNFNLPRDFILRFDIELTTDPAYLLEYGFSDKDRLDSDVAITRTRQNDYFNAGLTSFKTLRGSELAFDDQLPNFQGELLYERRFFPNRLGGQGSWSAGLETHRRQSETDQIGRDVSHVYGRLNWSKSSILTNGMVARFGGELSADAYNIAQDSSFAPALAFITPALEAELRWPLLRASANGGSQILEPVIHLAWTRNIGTNVPNEDSTIVEFDEGNLLTISRFPGDDRYESGVRTTLGLKWTRFDPNGRRLSLALGRVFRDGDNGQFTNASGLDGNRSDWLFAGQFKLDSRLSVTGRALFEDALDITKAETRISWNNDDVALASTYSWIVPDTAENRPDLTSQLTLDADYKFRKNWNSSLNYLYDFSASKATKAAFGLEYRNECISVNLSLSRRFTSSSSVTPTTEVGFSVSLLGFGSGDAGETSSCTGL